MNNPSLDQLNELTKELSHQPVPTPIAETVDDKLSQAASLIKDAQVTLIAGSDDVVLLEEQLNLSIVEIKQVLSDKDILIKAIKVMNLSVDKEGVEADRLKRDLRDMVLSIKSEIDKLM